MSLQTILYECGLPAASHEPVYGGDINRAYCLHDGGEKYFLKINSADKYPDMFQIEAKGLNALRNNCDLIIPEVIKTGIVRQEQFLLLEWIETGNRAANCWKSFGAQLAILHKKEQPFFGWHEDNYIGSLSQHNQAYTSWQSFYADCRILPLVKLLFDTGALYKQDTTYAKLFCRQLEKLFPEEPPTLVHGDLWNGNFMIAENGHASLFDPAVYYGHREMDIGMTKLFGGFDQQFYDAYNEVYPLKKGWQERLPITQLYPVLVHAVLFGGHYVEQAKTIMKRFS